MGFYSPKVNTPCKLYDLDGDAVAAVYSVRFLSSDREWVLFEDIATVSSNDNHNIFARERKDYLKTWDVWKLTEVQHNAV